MDGPKPYKSTPIFDENTLPAGLRKEHRTKPGVWGVIRILQGQLKYRVLDPVSETILDADGWDKGVLMNERIYRNQSFC